MKHIGWCLEKIQVAMAHIPQTIESEEDKTNARDVLREVEGYTKTIADIIKNPKFKKYLGRLEESPIEGVQLQAQHIEELFSDLEHALYVLNLYLKNLREIIDERPEQWKDKASQVSLMIHQKFGGERTELRKEFQVAVHTEEELRGVVKDEKHLEALLK